MVTQILKRNNDLASILLVDSFKEADLFLMILAIELTAFLLGLSGELTAQKSIIDEANLC